MSSLTRHLKRTFSTTTAAATTTVSTIKSISEDLYKERNLKRLVEKFKNFSSSDRFRTKSGIYEDTIRRLASAKRYKWIEEIIEHQKQYRHDISNEGFNVRLISLYGKSGMFENAVKVFDEMPERNCKRTVKSMNALLSACVNSNEFDRIEGLFKEVGEKLKVKPDIVSYNVLINGYCKMGKLESAVKMVDEMEKGGIKLDLITFNTILDGLYSSCRFLEGEKMWGRMAEKGVKPDIRSYNARIVGLVNAKRLKEGVELVGQLGNKGLKPDVFSFGALIKGYCNEGNLKEVKRWYNELVSSGCSPDKAVFGTIVSFACKKGDLDWAFELCKDIIDGKCIVDAGLLQGVVDGLMKESRIQDAEKVVQMGNSNNYLRYKLSLPLEK